MTLDPVRELRRKWYPPDGGSLESALNSSFAHIGLDEDHVASVIAGATQGFASFKSKVVKDSVWGMVELDGQAMRLLDSPIVQRLRAVKQLGFSYLTYPSAEHSRFVHSLGMYCVVSRFLDAMARPREELGQQAPFEVWRPDDRLKTDLLHAAILHDVGHLPFSHVTEKILEGYPDQFTCGARTVNQFLFDVEECLEKNLKLSECLSLAIVLSPRFERYYTGFVRPGEGDPDAVLRLAALISGLPVRHDLRGAADLISGTPVDADKIDYVVRDASACGIPVGIDVARLFLRSAFLRVPRAEFVKLLPKDRSDLEEYQTIFVLNASGVDTIEELAQARAALYQRVYLHQTTRNAERLLGRCFEALLPSGNVRFTDAFGLWSKDDFGLLRELISLCVDPVKKLGTRLRNRDLPKRACVFGRSMVTPLMPLKSIFPSLPASSYNQIFREIVGAALEPLRRGQLAPKRQAELEAAIVDETALLTEHVRRAAPDLIPNEDRPALVTFLPMPDLEEERKDCVVLENRELVHSSLRSVSDEQTDAADIFKSLGYVLTTSKWRAFVFIAARSVLYRQTTPVRRLSLATYGEDGGPRFEVACIGRIALEGRSTVRRAGLDPGAVTSIQTAAERAGYYDDKPHLAREPNDHRIESVAGRLSQFCGQGDWRVTPESCRAFVAQFPPTLRTDVMELLTNITVLDRKTMSTSLFAIIGKTDVPSSGRRFICALSPDSGQFVRMILQQELSPILKDANWEFAKSIQDVFRSASAGDSLVFCDDNSTSGSQAECQFMAWFGMPRDQWSHEQRREKGISDVELDARDKELLRQMNVAVAICAGSQRAADRLTARATQLKMSKFLGVAYDHEIKPHSAEVPEALREFLAAVGADLVARYRYGENGGALSLPTSKRRDCCDNALGYENAEGLLTTILNVPVSTITALWCPGLYQGRPWMPLLLRRGYLEQLVIS